MMIGQKVSVRVPQGTFTGRFVGTLWSKGTFYQIVKTPDGVTHYLVTYQRKEGK